MSSWTLKGATTLHRHGAGAARRFTLWAHNSEVTRSKRVAGIYHFASFAEAGRQAGRKREQPLTGMAQGQRAGLITPRSLDRNGLPVFYNSYVLQKHAVNASDFKQKLNTLHRGGAGVARGAHNSEDIGSRPISGIHSICWLYRNQPSSWT